MNTSTSWREAQPFQMPIYSVRAFQPPNARVGPFISIYRVCCWLCSRIVSLFPCLPACLLTLIFQENMCHCFFSAFQHSMDISPITTKPTQIKTSIYEVSGDRVDLCACVCVCLCLCLCFNCPAPSHSADKLLFNE